MYSTVSRRVLLKAGNAKWPLRPLSEMSETSPSRSVLFEAIRQQRYRQTTLLIEAGVDVNSYNEYEETPLIFTCNQKEMPRHFQIRFVRLLLDNGADPNLQDYRGLDALMHVTILGLKEIALLLLQHPEVEITLEDCEGNTALMYAAMFGQKDILAAILNKLHHKSKVSQLQKKNKQGLTGLNLAIKYEQDPCINILVREGRQFPFVSLEFPDPGKLERQETPCSLFFDMENNHIDVGGMTSYAKGTKNFIRRHNDEENGNDSNDFELNGPISEHISETRHGNHDDHFDGPMGEQLSRTRHSNHDDEYNGPIDDQQSRYCNHDDVIYSNDKMADRISVPNYISMPPTSRFFMNKMMSKSERELSAKMELESIDFDDSGRKSSLDSGCSSPKGIKVWHRSLHKFNTYCRLNHSESLPCINTIEASGYQETRRRSSWFAGTEIVVRGKPVRYNRPFDPFPGNNSLMAFGKDMQQRSLIPAMVTL